MKNLITLLFSAAIALCTLIACGTDEPDNPGTTSGSHTNSSSSSEVKPQIAKVSDATTTSDFTVTFRVKSVKTPTVSMKYGREPSKTNKPSLNRSSTPRCVNVVDMKSGGYSWYYYTTTHTGFRGGEYIYYQITASNSKGSDKSSVTYCIIRR